MPRASLLIALAMELLISAVCLLAGAANTARADEPRFLGRTRKEWVSELEASAGRRRRSHAAWALAQMADREAGPTGTMVWLNELFLLCEDESSTVRYWGQLGVQNFALKLPPNHPARASTIKLLMDAATDSSLAARIVAAKTLAQMGHADQGLEVLVDALQDPQESVRIQAIAALEKLGPTARPAEAALRVATSDPSEYVKRIATRALETLAAKP
jgi:HEAT repeat protein